MTHENQGLQGDPGQQGNPGIQGDQGLRGDPGVRGDRGRAGSQGVAGEQGLSGMQGAEGAEGHTGAQGVSGVQGDDGKTGEQGVQGVRGKAAIPFSRLQALAMFMLICITGAVLTWIGSEQNKRIESQQHEIFVNAEKIRDAAYEGCVGGLVTVRNFNAQQDALAAIEQSLANDPAVTDVGLRIAKARIRVYKAGKIALPPDFKCVR